MSFDSMERSAYGGKPYELYRFVMGTTVWCYTSSQTIKTFNGEFYLPETISHTAVEQNTDVFSGQIEVVLPLQHVVAKGFVNSAPPAPMWLTIWKNHEGIADNEAQIVRKGRVLKATHEQTVKLIVRPSLSSSRTKGPAPIYQGACNWHLYSSACGATINWITLSVYDIGSQPTSDSFYFLADPAAAPAVNLDAYALKNNFGYRMPTLAGGILQNPLTGEMVRISRHISERVGSPVLVQNSLTLEVPLSTPIANGDTFYVTKGCDKTLNNCRFWGRLQSYMGFPRFRGRDPFKQGIR